MIVRISDPALAQRLRERADKHHTWPAVIVAEALRAHLRRLDDVDSAYAEPLTD